MPSEIHTKITRTRQSCLSASYRQSVGARSVKDQSGTGIERALERLFGLQAYLERHQIRICGLLLVGDLRM